MCNWTYFVTPQMVAKVAGLGPSSPFVPRTNQSKLTGRILNIVQGCVRQIDIVHNGGRACLVLGRDVVQNRHQLFHYIYLCNHTKLQHPSTLHFIPKLCRIELLSVKNGKRGNHYTNLPPIHLGYLTKPSAIKHMRR